MVYVVWTDISSNMSEIFYRQSIDGGVKFGGLKEISKTRSINGEFALYPKIVTSGNNVFVAWQDKVLGGNEIFFRASNDGGNKFTGIKNLSRNNTGDSISPVLLLQMLIILLSPGAIPLLEKARYCLGLV